MNGRSIPGATQSLAVFAVALGLAGAARPARAEEPACRGEALPLEARPPAARRGGQRRPAPRRLAPRRPSPRRSARRAADGGELPAKTLAIAGGQGNPASWFYRAPLTVSVGEGAQRWQVTFYGFVEADYIFDTTRSYNDAIGSALVARSDTYEGTVGRTQFSMRNTRFGMIFKSPTLSGVKPVAVLEGDFFGNQPHTPPAGQESAFYDSPTFRMRHAYVKLLNDFADVLFGQTYDLFGWQNNYSPCSLEFLGLPNELFSRSAQLRLSHAFNATGPVSVDVAIAAVRPAQRDSQIPDANAGVRLNVNGWKGIATPGNVGTAALPLSIGVSGTVRQFKVDAFTPPPTQASNYATGWGVSIDALIPIIPAADAGDRGNRLTLTGSFVIGTGIADLINAGGGATFPTLLNPAQANPPPIYDPDIDNGLVSFDLQGVAHTIDWRAFRGGLQYYLPPTGRLIFAANYTQAHSNNLAKLFPQGGAEIELLGTVADTTRYADVNLFWDATPAVRFGLSGQYTQVEYLEVLANGSNKPHNIRGMGQALYVF